MANFCSKCGEKAGPDDKFCQSCGTGLTDAAPPAAAPVVRQIPARLPEPPVFIQFIKAGLQILILGLVLYWVWYSYNCAVGNHLNNGDQMCQSFYTLFNGGNNNNNDNNGGKGCLATGCPSYAPWNGCGQCWPTSGLCHSKGTSTYTDDCSSCRKCP